MKDYTLGKIYKMISPSGLIYVGSTCEPTLARRKAKHHNSYKCWKRGKSKFVTSYKLFDEDEDSVEIVLLEACPCNSKDELYKRERYYIELHDCVNRNVPTRTTREYYAENRYNILVYKKQYHIDNKEEIHKRHKQYHQLNRDKILEYKRQKFECACSGKYSSSQTQRHFRTITHRQYLRNQQFEAFIQTNPSLDDAVKNINLFH